MNIVAFAVLTYPGGFGTVAVLILPGAQVLVFVSQSPGIGIRLKGPHPCLFSALTYTLYVVPPMMFKEVVKLSDKLGVPI